MAFASGMVKQRDGSKRRGVALARQALGSDLLSGELFVFINRRGTRIKYCSKTGLTHPQCWTHCWREFINAEAIELGAQHVDVIQSLIATCRLYGVDPYDYLVDVLQRVGQHPAADVAQLTPRLWKQRFGKAPLRSDIPRRAA